MRRSDRTLMNAKPPSIEQGCNTMNSWHNNMSRISAIRNICHNMFVAHSLYTAVPRPSICSKLGSPLHIIAYESPKRWRRQIRNLCHANSTRTTTTRFRCYCHDRLSLSTSTANLPDSADVFFINLNLSGQLIPSGTHHCTTQFMEPSPCSIITAKTKSPFQSKSISSIFLTRHKPHSKKPCPEWFVTPMKQGSRSNGRLPFTFSAKEKATPHQGRFVRFFTTTRANEAFGPSEFRNIFQASVFAAKPFIKVLECSRIINARNRMPWLFHDHILHHVVG